MGNCISSCIVDSYEYSPKEYLFIDKKKQFNPR